MFTQYYSEGWGSKLFRLLDIRKRSIISEVLQTRADNSIILDLGSGLSTLLPLQTRRISVDCDAELLRCSGGRAIHADLDGPLPFRDRSVHFILMADSIEHLRSAEFTLTEIQRVLRDNGILLIFTPPYDSTVWVLAEKAHRWLTRRWAGHMSPMTRESLYRLMSRHFEDFSVSWFNFGLSMCAKARVPRQSIRP